MDFDEFLKHHAERSRAHIENGYIKYAVEQYISILKIFDERSQGKEDEVSFKESFKEILKDAKNFTLLGETGVMDYLDETGMLKRFKV